MCWYCNKVGHKATECRKKIRDEGGGKVPPTPAPTPVPAPAATPVQAALARTPEQVPAAEAAPPQAVHTHEERVFSLWCCMTMEGDEPPLPTHTTATPTTSAHLHKRTEFIIDSGASQVVTPYLAALGSNVEPTTTQFQMADGNVRRALMRGNLETSSSVPISGYYVPEATLTLIPVWVMLRWGYTVTYTVSTDGRTEVRLQRSTHPSFLFATELQGIMTVIVNEIEGIQFEPLNQAQSVQLQQLYGDVTCDDYDMPALEPIPEYHNDSDDEVVERVSSITMSDMRRE